MFTFEYAPLINKMSHGFVSCYDVPNFTVIKQQIAHLATITVSCQTPKRGAEGCLQISKSLMRV